MNHQQITTLWSSLIIEELVRHDIRRFCISPGSRSTPLTVAAARHPETECTIFPDERAAGFFALGYAKGAQRPAVLICTSGTAVANYYPAVVEASLDNRPMLILTADRPFELQETEANQTIRQAGIFGGYSRWNFQLPEPSEAVPAEALLSAVDHAVARSTGSDPGPVHLNAPFREPLDPATPPGDESWTRTLGAWKTSRTPLGRKDGGERPASPEAVERAGALLARASSVFLVAGSLDRREDAEAVLELSKTLGAPLYADITSRLRFHPLYRPLQHLMLSELFTASFRPDTVLHFGGKLVGKLPGAAMRQWRPEHVLVIRNRSSRYNPDHNVTLSLQEPPGAFARALAESPIQTRSTPLPVEAVCRETGELIGKHCAPGAAATEISTAHLLSKHLPEGHGLFLANSMPVRDMDVYAASRSGSLPPTGTNRGASGIDGNIATAAGFAEGMRKPVTLLIGDLSFLHDLNSLTLLRSLEQPLQIVVINNNGGGIFSFLPISAQQDIFETHFGTPQNVNLRHAAETFGLPYRNPSTNVEFIECHAESCRSGLPGIIEISGSRKDNLLEHRALNAAIGTIVDRHLCG